VARTLDDVPLRPNERAALEELRERLRGRFRERLVKLVLFGSKARGEGGDESDLDLLIVIRGYDRTGDDDDAVHSAAYDIDLRRGVFTQTIEYSEAEYRQRLDRETPLVTNIEREGVPL
jgi:predicted nucleotidyltransferase